MTKSSFALSELLEKRERTRICCARTGDLLERPAVELHQQLGERVVELAEREERAMPQSRQNPALHDQHAALDLGLVA